MIEINLTTAKKAVDLSNVGGIDLSKINVKMVLLAIVALYLPDLILLPELESKLAESEKRVEDMRTEAHQLKRKVDALQDYDKQVQALRRQEQKLNDKLAVVKSILAKRQNPWNIMVYVARNIPPEVWLTELLFEGNKITFKGVSMDYTPQGVFLDNLKKSVFFEKNVVYTKIETPTATPSTNADGSQSETTKNLAPFEIKATIARFE